MKWSRSRRTALTCRAIGRGATQVQVSQLDFTPESAEKGQFPHFMLKEIFEQPQTVRNALRGRIEKDSAMARFGGLNMTTAELRAVDRIVIAACGTSWHAGLVGRIPAGGTGACANRSGIRQRVPLPECAL